MTSLAVLRQGLHVSVSQIKGYLRCPRQYELRYVQGAEPAFVPVPLAFGSAFHEALGFYYGSVKAKGIAPSREETAQVFADAWAAALRGPVPLQNGEDEGTADQLDKGVAMLAAFHEHASATTMPQVESVETPFSVSLFDPETGEILEEQL
ncbi:MAG TPA: PD-(D/E)XK nuclease family protein, partial [Vulgatibacter sp.]